MQLQLTCLDIPAALPIGRLLAPLVWPRIAELATQVGLDDYMTGDSTVHFTEIIFIFIIINKQHTEHNNNTTQHNTGYVFN